MRGYGVIQEVRESGVQDKALKIVELSPMMEYLFGNKPRETLTDGDVVVRSERAGTEAFSTK